MKRYLLSFTLALLCAAGFTSTASAYTVLRSPAAPLDSVGVKWFQYTASSFVATGTVQTLVSYLSYDPSVATSGEYYVIKRFAPDGLNPDRYLDCGSSPFTPSSLALPSVANTNLSGGIGSYRVVSVSGTECNFNYDSVSQINPQPNGWAIYPAAADGTILNNPDAGVSFSWAQTYTGTPDVWSVSTTDATSSAIYQYQDTILAVATSSNALYCQGSYPNSGSSIGDAFGFAMCTVAGFLFVPQQQAIQQFTNVKDQLGGKFPFSWIGDVQARLTGYTASTTQNFINLNLNFGSSTQALGFGTLDAISTSTLSRYYPDTIRNTFKTMIAWVFYLLAITFIYRQVLRIWNHNNA